MAHGRFGTLAAVAAALAVLVSGCSGDDGDKKKDKADDTKVTASSFCKDFTAQGGSESAIRPLPARLDVDVIKASLSRGLAAMKDLEPPVEIKKSWDAVEAHYTSAQAVLEQAPKKGKLPKAQRKQLQEQTDEVFDLDGRAVINYVLKNCS